MAQGQIQALVFCGPSGSGKSTFIQKLFKDHPDKFGFSVSHTTRQPRPGEVNGVHYHFTTREDMEAAIANGEFLESAVFSNNLYGTRITEGLHVLESITITMVLFFSPDDDSSQQSCLNIDQFICLRNLQSIIKECKKAVECVFKDGKVCVLDIDVQGVKQVKQTDLKALYVFIKPPSLEVLAKRLRDRGTETEESLAERLSVAATEIEYGDTPLNFDIVVVNDHFDNAYETLTNFIFHKI